MVSALHDGPPVLKRALYKDLIGNPGHLALLILAVPSYMQCEMDPPSGKHLEEMHLSLCKEFCNHCCVCGGGARTVKIWLHRFQSLNLQDRVCVKLGDSRKIILKFWENCRGFASILQPELGVLLCQLLYEVCHLGDSRL